MLERVVRAICMPDHDHTAEPKACCGKCNAIVDKARAAIKAMREPTQAMVNDGILNGVENGFGCGYSDYVDLWQAMVDGALKE